LTCGDRGAGHHIFHQPAAVEDVVKLQSVVQSSDHDPAQLSCCGYLCGDRWAVVRILERELIKSLTVCDARLAVCRSTASARAARVRGILALHGKGFR